MIYEEIFKPKTFDDYVGQEKAKEIIQIMIEAADEEDRDYPNLLLTGSAGLGKTSLAQIILDGIPHQFIDGSSVNTQYKELQNFVIIDEIHNVKPEVCDSLNLVIDKGDIVIMGCTTNPGMLPGPFRSRFQTITLTPYSIDNLVQIQRNVLIRKNTLKISDELLVMIANRGRGTPRVTLKYLAFAMDLMVVRKYQELSEDLLLNAFDMLGVDEQGLLQIDHSYLESFPPNNRPVGIQYLAAVLSQDKETIEQEIEPYLLQLKLIDRTPRGRVKIQDKSEAIRIANAIFADMLT